MPRPEVVINAETYRWSVADAAEILVRFYGGKHKVEDIPCIAVADALHSGSALISLKAAFTNECSCIIFHGSTGNDRGSKPGDRTVLEYLSEQAVLYASNHRWPLRHIACSSRQYYVNWPSPVPNGLFHRYHYCDCKQIVTFAVHSSTFSNRLWAKQANMVSPAIVGAIRGFWKSCKKDEAVSALCVENGQHGRHCCETEIFVAISDRGRQAVQAAMLKNMSWRPAWWKDLT